MTTDYIIIQSRVHEFYKSFLQNNMYIIRRNVMNYAIMSSAWQLPCTTLYFAPSNVKFLYIRTI